MARKDSRKIGMARALSKLGYCSRSQAGELIRAGRVHLNGSVIRDPETPVRIEQDRISVGGIVVESRQRIYLVMNKPRGLVTTASDEKGRQTVYSILSAEALPWVAPVGRLDKASEGLLLLTNDSEWSARVTDPETHLEKTYHVQINRVGDETFVQKIVRGVKASDGEFLQVKKCRLLRSGEKNCWLEITLDEGKNRQIRRALEVLGADVLRLVRVAVGPLRLGTLGKGSHRRLAAEEKAALDRAMRSPGTRKSR